MTNDNYKTDRWIIEMFKDWYDPCPLSEKPEFNGRTFKIECYWNADGRKISSYGVASRKKVARKKAAFFMLQKMGIEA